MSEFTYVDVGQELRDQLVADQLLAEEVIPYHPVLTQVERVNCPSCVNPVPLENVASKFDRNSALGCERRTMTIDCPHCGKHQIAIFNLIGGVWCLANVPKLMPRNRRSV